MDTLSAQAVLGCPQFVLIKPMKIIGPNPDQDFTMVPNGILFAPIGPGLKVAWIQLLSLCRNGESPNYARRFKDAAQELGIDYNGLSKSVSRLRSAGAITFNDGNAYLVVPAHADAPQKPSKPQQKAEQLIAPAVEAQPKRKPSGISQKDSWDSISEAWNSTKPDCWARLDGRFNLPLYIAIETQAKRLEIPRQDYPAFIEFVCEGAKQEEWWSNRANMKPSSVFGFGKVEDKKFNNVEKLYNIGKSIGNKFSWDNERSIYRWYNEAYTDRQFREIRRISLPSLQDCWDHDWSGDNPDDVIFLYINEESGRIEHWTGKTHNRKLYNPPY